MKTNQVLLLNASFEPIMVISSQRSLCLIISGRAEYIEHDYDHLFRSPSVTFRAPVVIRLISYVKIPAIRGVGLSRRAVLLRDGGKCVYCGDPATTIDHLVPRSRGGLSTWDNLCACCRRCNGLKGDKLLSELGWTLKTPPPRAPSTSSWFVVGWKIDDRWRPYL